MGGCSSISITGYERYEDIMSGCVWGECDANQERRLWPGQPTGRTSIICLPSKLASNDEKKKLETQED